MDDDDYDRDRDHDRMAARRAHNRLIDDLDREIAEDALTVENDIGKVLNELPPLVIKPGSHHAAAAFRQGREDEYIDGMRNRYGGEW